jgi:hypothetical protein
MTVCVITLKMIMCELTNSALDYTDSSFFCTGSDKRNHLPAV